VALADTRPVFLFPLLGLTLRQRGKPVEQHETAAPSSSEHRVPRNDIIAA
jgi:hypothetical protein